MRRVFLITSLAAIILISVGTQFVNAKPTAGPIVPGDLDSTFGANGFSYVDINSASGDKAYAVVEQPDGKIVVVGASDSGSGDDFAVIRLKGNGQLDGSFDGDGKVTTSITTTHDVAYGVALQMDNKIVVVGTTFDGVDNNFAVVRYTDGGSLDITFGGDGIVETDITAGDDIARAIAIQGDGKIVVAGIANNDFAVVRYNENGTLDGTFSGDGIVVTDFFGSNDEGHAIAIDPVDGRIVVAGFADIGSSEEFAVARYDSSGSLDSTFGGNGKVTTDFQNNSVDQAFAVALQEDGKVVLAGFVNSDVGGTDDFALARFNSNGSLDPTFDGDGRVITPVGSADDQAYGVEIQPTGKIVVAGFANMGEPTNQDFAIARYSSSGALDTTFGNSGIVLTDLGTINTVDSSADEAYALALQADNKILVAGFTDYPAGNDNFAIARYRSPNNPPTVSNVNKNGLEDINTFFSEADFTTSFSDPDFDNLVKIRIGSLPAVGTLALDGIPVSIDQEIFAFELPNLSFAAPSNWNGSTNFDWNGSDGLTYASAAASVILNILPVNDAPSFTAGSNQELNEDAAPQSILAWASDILPGPVDEVGQVVTFTVQTDNDPLFTTLPTIDAGTGNLTFTTAENQNGVAVVTVTLKDDGGTQNSGVDTSPPQSFTISINVVNDAPSYTAGSNQELNEDAAPQSILAWAGDISPGPVDEVGQVVTFTVQTDNDTLFTTLPTIDAGTGDLSFTTAANQNGVAVVTVTLKDDGGTQNSGVDTSPPQNFTISIDAVNDVPSFTSGPNQEVDEDAGLQLIPSWAANISGGPADEAGQTLNFILDTDNDPLFAVQPEIDATTGDLTFTTVENQNGVAVVTVTLKDDGGTQNSGVDTSLPQSFTISINEVNDAPSFTSGPDQEVDEDAGLQSIPGWAANISGGPTDEAGQNLNFIVETDNDPLFAVQPEIDATTGDLTFTPAENQNGAATVTVILMDDGGTQKSGIDTSSTHSFTISINPVNDRPVVTDFAKAGLKDVDLAFLASDFENHFSDIDGDTLLFVEIPNLPIHGKMSVEGVQITVGQKIQAKDLDTLVFTPEAGWTGETELTWNGSDGSANAVVDATVSISLSERTHFMLFLPVILGGS